MGWFFIPASLWFVRLIAHSLWMRSLPRIPPGVFSLGSFARLIYNSKLEAMGDVVDPDLATLRWYPFWLRFAGGKIGEWCEIHVIEGGIPELLDFGDECFFGGLTRLITGASSHSQGLVCNTVKLQKRSFTGNGAAISGGTVIPSTLIGIGTSVDHTHQKELDEGKNLFGHPPIELPRNSTPEEQFERPDWGQYLLRVCHELGRPLVLGSFYLCLYFTFRWIDTLKISSIPYIAEDLVLCFLCVIIYNTCSLGFIIIAKWLLVGKIQPGEHGLWCRFTYAWDLYHWIADTMGKSVLAPFAGTIGFPAYLNLLGADMGSNVYLGAIDFTDPDMLKFGNNHCSASHNFQAHTFEDRILKFAPVNLKDDSTTGFYSHLLAGCSLGSGSSVEHGSVLMKDEAIEDDCEYVGYPAQPA